MGEGGVEPYITCHTAHVGFILSACFYLSCGIYMVDITIIIISDKTAGISSFVVAGSSSLYVEGRIAIRDASSGIPTDKATAITSSC